MPILGIIASGIQGSLNAGSFESIATVTVGAGGSSSVTFSSIPSTYTHLQVRGLCRPVAYGGGATLGALRINSDSGNNYNAHELRGNGSTAAAYANGTDTKAPFIIYDKSTGSDNYFNAFVCDFLDYANSNKYKTFRTLNGQDTNGGGFVQLSSCLWMSTSVITSITLYPSDNLSQTWQQYSSFALYGIRSA